MSSPPETPDGDSSRAAMSPQSARSTRSSSDRQERQNSRAQRVALDALLGLPWRGQSQKLKPSQKKILQQASHAAQVFVIVCKY